ncbi:transcription factor HIVEP3 [Anarhichas minor]|uniref:transcription factor HIVEP3 n=1 Tax=Anarhichas minor TaxID=65739 RepID=UPI003F731D22
MEAEHSRPADGESSGRQEQQQLTTESSLGSCPPQQPQHPPNPRPVHRALGRLQNRQPKRSDLLLRLQQQQAVAWQHSDTPGPSGGSFFSPASSSTTSLPSTSSTRGEHGQGVPSQSSQEGLEGVSSPRKGEKKPQKPGKYVCTYCGRPCAKPSVLQKHIRSHTGERPYPCAPCGFSFKTKSNLYKHRKSHAHRIKAGLASSRDEPSLSGPEGSGVGEDPEEHTEGESTESEEETGQHRKSSSKEMLGQQRKGGKEPLGGSEESQRPEDSQAVKQRLALRLSERKRGPMASPDDPPSSLSTSSSSQGPGSKGSTESGYFSGSGSTDLSQVSPPSASAKTYAEIILGKYGRLGGQQRSPHQQQPHSLLSSSAGTEEKSIPFAVPKTQVIEHITKLITINEAVVDTREIDSVKPRRSSLSRKSSMESPKFTSPRDPYTFDPKGEAPGPSGLKHLHNPEADPAVAQELSAVPLLRSHSMPSSTSQGEPSTSGTMSPKDYRLCQSFDEQQAVVAEMRVGHAQRMLRRQPAIEDPLGAELMLEEAGPTSSSSASGAEQARQLQQQQQQQQQQKSPSMFECEACGVHFQHNEGYEAHRGICPGQQTLEKVSRDSSKTCREDRPQMMMHYSFRALAMAARKRRKEESLEEDPPSPGSVAMSGSSAGLIPVPSRPEHSHTLTGVSLPTEPQQQQQQQQQQDRKGVSVIQHTSSFEKQESVSMESQETELRESQHTQQLEPKPSPSTSRLIRQPNIQVPEILVTVEPDADMPSVSPPVTASSFKEAERVEEFQWPQRSQTLAQLPAEKLPPKKKRLRLAEAAQSSGESSFESASLPRSPSQESNISHASSLSASFEDTARPETAIWASSSQSSQMLMVPSASHQHHQSHKEMRRSASEQITATPQQTEQVSETRSKSFDYGSLSPQQSASSWKERRKCLLVKHATLGEAEQEEGASMSQLSRAESPKPGPSRSIHPPIYSTEASSRFSLEVTGKALQLLQPRIFPHSQDALPLQQAFPPGSLSQLLPVTTAISEVLSTQITHRAFLHSQAAPPAIQIHPGQIHMAERLGIPFHQLPALVPLPFSSRTTANQALYLPFPPRLTVPSLRTTESSPSISSMSSALTHQSLVRISYHHPQPVIATCLAQLTPVVSLVVPVRLQTHIPTYASAMYTTLSQILASTCSQEPISCTAMVIMGQVERDKLQRSYLKVPSPYIKSLFPLSLPTELASGSGEGYGPLGAGGSKRMLSPAASLELSTEAQRHQKRVKEEEEGEEDEAGEEEEDVEQKVRQEEESKATGRKLEESEKKQPERVTVKVEGEHEQVPRKHNRKEKEEKGEEEESTKKTSKKKEEVAVVEKGAEKPAAPSYPSLHTSASVNWCYLNYVKPNPSALTDPRSSVYSTWSVSAHNPNLPGLTTKVALSLLCSKQKHSSETYTVATAPTPAKSKLAPASSRTPRVSEVHATPPSTLTKVKDQQQHDKEENKEMREEEEPSTSKQSEPSRVRICEGGYRSNEEYVYVRGRGRGKYICGDCGIRCKKPSMLKKHIRTHTDVRPYICKHCNFAFKTKGNLTKHTKSKAHGKKCQAMGVSESSLDEPESEETAGSDERVCGSEGQEEHQFTDVEDSEDDDDNDDDDDDEEEESASHDDPSSCSSDTHPSTGGHSSCSRRSQQGTPDPEPPGPSPCPGQELSPRGVWLNRRAASPGSRRALFSRRGWKASPRAFSPSSESCSPSRSLSPRLELSSPIRSLSPRTELSSPSRHVSPSPERGPSPIRPLSPLRTISPSCYRSSQARTPPSPLGLQHRTPGYLPWESPGTRGGHVKPVKRGTAAEGPTLPEASLFPPAFRLSICEGYPGHQTADNIFSHLPKHSQQAKVPYLMIPIGGIQMVQASPRSHPTTPSSPTSPPMEGPSLSRFESYWGGTPRTQGLRTPGDHWSEDQTAGTSQSGRCVLSTALICSKQKLETTDSKQYGSSHSSAHTRRPATETTKHCFRDSSRATLSLAAPVASHVIGQQPEGDEPPSGGDLVEGGAKGDGADQST